MASILPIGIQPIPFQSPSGALYRSPVGLLKPVEPLMGGNSVRLDIDWSAAPYDASTLKPTVAISINLLGQAVQTPLDEIRSVYIDNSNSITPIYVLFPDTNFLIQCPPRSVAWQPVLTGQQKAIVFGVGFVTGLIPVTPIHFSNIPVAGYCIQVAGANLVRGKTLPSVFNGGSSATQTANYAGIPASENRVIVASACAGFGSIAASNFTGFTIGGIVATLIGTIGDGQVTTGIMGYAVVPTGTAFSVTVNTNRNSVVRGIQAWALYNTSQRAPFNIDFGTGATNGPVNVSPFVTKDGFAIMSSIYGNVTNDTDWTNAIECGQESGSSGGGAITFSNAIISDGSDNYIPVIADMSRYVIAASFN